MPQSPLLPALLVCGAVAALVALGWGAVAYRTSRSSLGPLVAIWTVLLVGADAARVGRLLVDTGVAGTMLLAAWLAALLAAQVLIVRALVESWVDSVLDVFLTGAAVILTGWSMVLITGRIPGGIGPVDLFDVTVATWMVATVAMLSHEHTRPANGAVVLLHAIPLLHLAGVVVLLVPRWQVSDLGILPGVVLLCGSYVALVAVLLRSRRLPPPGSAATTRVGRLLPHVLVLTALILSMVATVVRDGDAAPSPEFLMLCLVVAIALGIRQILTSDANAELSSTMAERERLYRSVVQDSTDVIMIADLTGRLEYVSPASVKVLDAPASSMVGRPVAEVLGIAPRDLDTAVTRAVEEGVHQRVESKVAGPAVARSVESMISVRGDTVVLNVRDVTEYSRLREQLHDLAFHDPLTGLFNRARLMQSLASRLQAWEKQGGDAPAVLFLDLDGFKAVNDVAGHAAGDKVLRRVADRLDTITAPGAVLARLGGDEFVVVLASGSAEVALAEAERIAKQVSQPYAVEDGTFVIGVSIGVAHAVHGDQPEDLLRNADLAMYSAKRARRPARVFEPSMHSAAVRRVDGDLLHAQALDQERVELHYQPVVTLDTEQPVGVEALLRWRADDGTLGPPEQLLEYAVRSGRMEHLSAWVVDAALDQVADWRQDLGLLPVSVNLAPVELLRTGLVRTLREELAVRDLPASVLTIEVTEQVLMQDPDRAIRVISDLRALGIRVSIDDFGTGFSSLAYLVDLPVDGLKIDRSFVQALPRQPAARVVVAGIIEMARSLQVQVVAEGIETTEQRDLLAAMGDPLCQGDLFSPAVAADVTADLVRAARGLAPREPLSAPVGRTD